jgi:hypothetical protein
MILQTRVENKYASTIQYECCIYEKIDSLESIDNTSVSKEPIFQ